MRVERTLVLWNLVLHFSACGTRSGIVDFRVTFFCAWNALWYCGIPCYIFPRVECAIVLCYILLRMECALVLWNFVLHFSACETRFGIVELFVVCFSVCNVLW